MAKFKIRMKLQGLELDIEGSREDIPLITQNLGEQLSSLLQPAGAIIEGEVLAGQGPKRDAAQLSSQSADTTATAKRKVRKRAPVVGSESGSEISLPVDWKHEASIYGTPSQSWSTANKGIWLLYVLKEAADTPELSGGRIAATFNKHFRQAGQIKTGQVNRDFGQLKVKSGTPPVSEDTTKTPSQWFLTDAGRTKAQSLVAESLGRA